MLFPMVVSGGMTFLFPTKKHSEIMRIQREIQCSDSVFTSGRFSRLTNVVGDARKDLFRTEASLLKEKKRTIHTLSHTNTQTNTYRQLVEKKSPIQLRLIAILLMISIKFIDFDKFPSPSSLSEFK